MLRALCPRLRRSTLKTRKRGISWLLVIMCTDNMAGQKYTWKLNHFRNILWFSSVLIVSTNHFHNVSAQTESNVLTVTDANWTHILEGEWMLKFYAPWCPACQHIRADWEALAKESDNLGISVGKVDVTQQPGLSGRFLVTTLPTIFHAKDGSFRRYMSSRTTEDIRAYIVQKKWEAVEPLPGWKSPSSFLMSGMAGLFRLSVWIRQIHTYLMDTFGIPSWGSYVIFAIVTLFMGLLLGLMLVLIADCICPSRPKRKEDRAVYVKAEGSEDEMDSALTEEKRMSDLDNESERVSAEESTDEEGSPVAQIASSSSEEPQPHGAAEASLRKRKARGPNSPEGT